MFSQVFIYFALITFASDFLSYSLSGFTQQNCFSVECCAFRVLDIFALKGKG